MLSDEEKKAIEFIKSELQDEKVRVDYQSLSGLYGNLEIEIILNLIEKQSKEIEDYIENKELINQTLGLEKDSDINKTLERIIILNNYEDKIKAKIEELDTLNAYKLMESPYMVKLLKEQRYDEFMVHLKQSEVEIANTIMKAEDKINELVRAVNTISKELKDE